MTHEVAADAAGADDRNGARLPGEEGSLKRLLVDSIPDYAIIALDERGAILTWNAGAERLTKYAASEIVGRPVAALYPDEDIARAGATRELELAAATGRSESEGWRVRKDGSRFWANVVMSGLYTEHGRLVGFALVARDLSARRATEAALNESEQRFQLLVQSVRDYAIFMLDPRGYIATWNAGAERIKGYSAADAIGRHFSIFYSEIDLAAGKPERELRIASATGHYEEAGWRLRKDGTRFWASVVITAVRNANGTLAGFAKVTRDLTERRAAQERALEDARRIAAKEGARAAAEQRAHELRTLAAQLQAQALELERRGQEAEAANRVKTQFLAAMSHELRTPLNAIGGYAQLMQLGLSGPLTGEQASQLDRIQRSQKHLLGIINDILNFSRLEGGHLLYDIQDVSIRDTLESVASMITPLALERGLQLSVGHCPPEAVARVDRSKLEQILINLLSNAVKFTPPGGMIELSCGVSEDRIWLSVRDTGVGIPENELEKIFAPFAQVGRSLASPKDGTGLGLSISRDLARAMSGDLTVESVFGAGSTFTLTVPRARSVV